MWSCPANKLTRGAVVQSPERRLVRKDVHVGAVHQAADDVDLTVGQGGRVAVDVAALRMREDDSVGIGHSDSVSAKGGGRCPTTRGLRPPPTTEGGSTAPRDTSAKAKGDVTGFF